MSAASPGTQTTLGEAFERATQAAETAESPTPPEDDQQDTDVLACGHAPVWAESGTCLACEPAVGAAGAVAERQQLGDDAGGGRL